MGMEVSQRRRRVFETVKARGEVHVQALIDELGVSGMTVRRDLSVMEQQRLIRRAYGKAIWIADDYYEVTSFEARCAAQREAKQRIAKLAAEHLRGVSSLFVDGSSTCRELVCRLPRDQKMSVYTNSLAAVQVLRSMPWVKTFVLGGFLTEDQNSLDSDATVSLVKSVYVDAAFVSCSGFSTRGLVNNGLSEARLKGIMMDNAERTYLLADHTKWNARALFDISRWERIHTFITDAAVDATLMKTLRAKNVRVQWPEGKT